MTAENAVKVSSLYSVVEGIIYIYVGNNLLNVLVIVVGEEHQ